MIQQYRKKPVVVEAWQLTEDDEHLLRKWVNDNGGSCRIHPNRGVAGLFLIIETLEGPMNASIGDYIIKGVEDEFYPCKRGIFEATYERVAQPHGYPF